MVRVNVRELLEQSGLMGDPLDEAPDRRAWVRAALADLCAANVARG